MRNLTLVLLLCWCGCVSNPTSRGHARSKREELCASSWQVRLSKPASRKLLAVTGIDTKQFLTYMIRVLSAKYQQWNVTFSTTEGQGCVDVWLGKGIHDGSLGYADMVTRKLTKNRGLGVFLDAVLDEEVKQLSQSAILRYTSDIIAHEIGHAYGLRHIQGRKCDMMSGYGAYPGIPCVWSKFSKQQLDKIIDGK